MTTIKPHALFWKRGQEGAGARGGPSGGRGDAGGGTGKPERGAQGRGPGRGTGRRRRQVLTGSPGTDLGPGRKRPTSLWRQRRQLSDGQGCSPQDLAERLPGRPWKTRVSLPGLT